MISVAFRITSQSWGSDVCPARLTIVRDGVEIKVFKRSHSGRSAGDPQSAIANEVGSECPIAANDSSGQFFPIALAQGEITT